MKKRKVWRGKLWASLTGDGKAWDISYHGRPQLSRYKTEIQYGCSAIRVEVTIREVVKSRRKR